ncbi:MAG: hypothetical protein WDM80_08040 [Limisphaerales bacterium]
MAAAILGLQINQAVAQFGGGAGGFNIDGALKKVFGDNNAFTATLQANVKPKAAIRWFFQARFGLMTAR